MRLNNKVAIVTGSGSGIGKAIALALGQAGADVVVADVDEPGGQATVNALEAVGRKAFFHRTDVARAPEAKRVVEAALDRFGRLDVLVNNAGVQHVAPIQDFPEEKWDLVVGVMLTGAFLLSKYAFPLMIRQRSGRIINIASAHGLVASPYKAAYVAAKHGLLGLTKVLALEGAPHDITAVAICPGYVRTPLVERQIADQARAHGIPEHEVLETVIVREHAVKRLLESEEVGELAVFLTTEAARGITGTHVALDLGWTAH